MAKYFPELDSYFIDSSFWFCFLAFLLFDDLSQYCWHRLSHVNKTMWKFHRPHHVVEEMGILVTYRNAVLYYAMIPGIWFSGMLVFMGMGTTLLIYLSLKLTIILLAHSEVRWDKIIFKHKFIEPLAWLEERTISTPCINFAHHGLT